LLGQTQAASSQNKKDIVEFLNIKVVEHEQHITELLRRIKELEDEKIMIKENRNILLYLYYIIFQKKKKKKKKIKKKKKKKKKNIY